MTPDGLLQAGLGTALLAVTSVDMILTTVRVGRRAGPVTRVVSEWTWRLVSRAATGSGPPPGTGPTITFLVVTVWLSSSLLGWYLVFAASPEAVVNGSTGEPADGWARLYYTAFTISTLGIGDYAPAGAAWQALTGMAATRSGDRFEGLDGELASLARDIHGLAEQQLTYPLLVYFGTRDRDAAVWPALTVLSETLYVLEHHVAEDARPAPLRLGSLRRAIDSYLGLFSDVPTSRLDDPPLLVDLQRMGDAGIPLAEAAAKPGPTALPRRRRLQALLQRQGWAWDSAVNGAERRLLN